MSLTIIQFTLNKQIDKEIFKIARQILDLCLQQFISLSGKNIVRCLLSSV